MVLNFILDGSVEEIVINLEINGMLQNQFNLFLNNVTDLKATPEFKNPPAAHHHRLLPLGREIRL